MCFEPEDFTGGETLDRGRGVPARGDGKKLVVTNGSRRVAIFHQFGLLWISRNLDLRQVVESKGEIFQWYPVNQGGRLHPICPWKRTREDVFKGFEKWCDSSLSLASSTAWKLAELIRPTVEVCFVYFGKLELHACP